MTASSKNRYDAVAISLHWLIALLIIFMLFFGEDLMDRRNPNVFNASVHASVGAAILVLSLVRLIWRMKRSPPILPPTMKPWETTLSKITHTLFYIMMIGLPITGWLAFSSMVVKHAGFLGTSFFGLLRVVQVPAAIDVPFDGIHSLGSNIMIALVCLHVLAALKHQFFDRDDLLRRMLP